MLVSMTEITQKALAGGYAIAQFNLNNLEWTKAILLAAQETKSPVILGVNPAAADYMGGAKAVAGMVFGMLDFYKIDVPVALHLDHGTREYVAAAIEAGFTSVMYDGSNLPIEENVKHTKEIIDRAHPKGISVEAEVGGVGGEEDGIKGVCAYSSPAHCAAMAEIGVDVLAAGIGNIHGKYPPDWQGLSFATLEAAAAAAQRIPLALHGGTGIEDKDIKHAIALGIAKINVNTECQIAFAAATKEYFAAGLADRAKGYDPKKLFAPGIKAIEEKVKEKLTIFGSIGKA